jgi:hypothetical protein
MRELNKKALLLMPLGEEELPDLENFDSGDIDDNHYFLNEAYGEQQRGLNTTTLVYHHGLLAAFFSLCCDVIPIKVDDGEKSEISLNVPAIKIRYAVDKNYQDMDLDSFIISYVKNLAWELTTTKVGARFLTLDTDPSKEEFYTSKGFVRNAVGEEYVSMRLDIMLEKPY